MRLPDVREVALDTECSGLFPDDGARVACVGLAWVDEAGEVQSLGLPFDQGERCKFADMQLGLLDGPDPNLGEAEWRELCAWLARRETLIMHNAKYDLTVMAAGSLWPGVDLEASGVKIWDTMVAEKDLARGAAVGLDATAERRGFGGKQGKNELKAWLTAYKRPVERKQGRYDLVPWSIAEPYVRTDAEITLLVAGQQRRDMAAGECAEWVPGKVERELELMRVLFRLEQRGIGFDDARSLEAAEVLEGAAARLEGVLPFRGPKEAKRWFFVGQGVQPLHVSDKTGEPLLDEEQTRRMVADGVEWAAEYAEATRLRRAVSMWYRGYPEKIGPDGRLRASFRQLTVKSGRMSVERVQLQAIPKMDKSFEGVPHVRELIQAREGYELWNLDLSQAELRVAAKYAKCRKMLEMLLGGADFHGYTCERVLGTKPEDPNWKAQRDIAKRLSFGSIFQIGPKTFQGTLGKLANLYLSEERCAEMVWAWRAEYPEFGVAYRKAERLAREKGSVPILPGTEYASRSYLSERDFPNTGWNRIVQGSLAELLKMWLLDTEKRHPGKMVLTVHDSLVLELKKDEGAEEIAADVAARGAAIFTQLFDIQGGVDFGRWHKD